MPGRAPPSYPLPHYDPLTVSANHRRATTGRRCRRGLAAVSVLAMLVACSPDDDSNGSSPPSTSPAPPSAPDGTPTTAQACSLDAGPGAGEGAFPSEVSLPGLSRDGIAHKVRPGQSVTVHVEIGNTSAKPVEATLCVTLSCSALDPAQQHRVGFATFEVPGRTPSGNLGVGEMDLPVPIHPKCEPLEDNDGAHGSLNVIVRDNTGRAGAQKLLLTLN